MALIVYSWYSSQSTQLDDNTKSNSLIGLGETTVNTDGTASAYAYMPELEPDGMNRIFCEAAVKEGENGFLPATSVSESASIVITKGDAYAAVTSVTSHITDGIWYVTSPVKGNIQPDMSASVLGTNPANRLIYSNSSFSSGTSIEKAYISCESKWYITADSQTDAIGSSVGSDSSFFLDPANSDIASHYVRCIVTPHADTKYYNEVSMSAYATPWSFVNPGILKIAGVTLEGGQIGQKITATFTVTKEY